ncbi:MAG: 50S ribosomal protein L21 [Oscillospiraceae bacterium]|nr:50S ribosomal protein L21 [Oscillospiraceae bacterium]
MYAVIETGGKQYQVSNGDVLFIEKLDVEQDTEYLFDKVVFLNKEGKVSIGTPYVKGASVTATVLKNGKGKKIEVFTYKAHKNQKRKMGHRQPYTQVRIDSIATAPKRTKKIDKD